MIKLRLLAAQGRWEKDLVIVAHFYSEYVTVPPPVYMSKAIGKDIKGFPIMVGDKFKGNCELSRAKVCTLLTT